MKKILLSIALPTLLVLGCLLVNATSAFAQKENLAPCGTVYTPEMETILREWAHQYYTLGQRTSSTRLYLPMSAQLVGDDDGSNRPNVNTVLNDLCAVNTFYDTLNIQFYLANLTTSINNTDWNSAGVSTNPPSGNSNYYTSMPVANNFPNTINSYIHGSQIPGLCGVYHGSAVGSGGTSGGSPDIVNCSASCVSGNGKTWAHEVGHYLSLPHTFYGLEGSNYGCGFVASGSSFERVARTGSSAVCNCSTTGDFFCDTEPDYFAYRWNCDANGESCPVKNVVTVAGVKDTTTFKIKGKNIMSYADDICAKEFTSQQRDAMRYMITHYRTNLHATTPPTAGAIVDPVVAISPTSGAYLPSTAATFQWQPVANATDYYIQISRTNYFAVIADEGWVKNATSFTTTKLGAGKNYYWRVRPFNKRYFCQPFSAPTNFTTGVLSVEGVNEFSLQPNPSASVLTLHVGTQAALEGDLVVTNMQGQTVKTIANHRFDVGESEVSISVYDLPNGVYFLTFKTQSGALTQKLVVTH